MVTARERIFNEISRSDFQGSATLLNEFSLDYDVIIPNSGGQQSTFGVVPDSILDPDYGLKTSATDPDGDTTTTSYSNSTIGPEYGLPTATTVGAGSSTPLTTTMAHEAPGAGSFLRKTSSTLPGGGTTTYSYYTAPAARSPRSAVFPPVSARPGHQLYRCPRQDHHYRL